MYFKSLIYIINIPQLILSNWQLLEDAQYELTKFKGPVSWRLNLFMFPKYKSHTLFVMSRKELMSHMKLGKRQVLGVKSVLSVTILSPLPSI